MKNRVTISQEVFHAFSQEAHLHKATAIDSNAVASFAYSFTLYKCNHKSVLCIWFLLFNIMSGDSFMLLKVQFVFIAIYSVV